MVEGSSPSAPATTNDLIMITYFKETVSELKKLATPPKREVYITTGTIFVVVTVFALAIMLSDFTISKIMGIIF